MTVCVWKGMSGYQQVPPFDPPQRFPELRSEGLAPGGRNAAFEGVRACLRMAGLDEANFGKVGWNPLGKWIEPGHTVLLKPNWVKLEHPRDARGFEYMITHGSIVRAVAEYVAIALQGRGRVVVGDGPQTDSDFVAVADALGVRTIGEALKPYGVEFELVDFRRERWRVEAGVVRETIHLAGDPRGYEAYDLGVDSRFCGHGGEGRYYGAFYDEEEVNRHHSGGRHEYLLTGSAIDADVFVNLPKLKTHKKTGVTLSLKNLVGINGDKNWLPHHTSGTPERGGDQFPSESARRRLEMAAGAFLRRVAVRLPFLGRPLLAQARKAGRPLFGGTESVIRSGNWWGNDTTWRMALDLNAVLLWGQRGGTIGRATGRKPYLSVVDGIRAGEGDGPLDPDPVEAGVVCFGEDPGAVDAACTVLMGFDPDRVPVVREAFAPTRWPISNGNWNDVEITTNHEPWRGRIGSLPRERSLAFRPHFGWSGALERLGGEGSQGIERGESSTGENR